MIFSLRSVVQRHHRRRVGTLSEGLRRKAGDADRTDDREVRCCLSISRHTSQIALAHCRKENSSRRSDPFKTPRAKSLHTGRSYTVECQRRLYQGLADTIVQWRRSGIGDTVPPAHPRTHVNMRATIPTTWRACNPG